MNMISPRKPRPARQVIDPPFQLTAAVEKMRAKEKWIGEMRQRALSNRLRSTTSDEREQRVYRETVIIDDDQILIGVLTGESDPWPPRNPAG